MSRKLELTKKLRQQRALRQREQFVMERIAAMPLEHGWAMNGTELPCGTEMPPVWTKAAIRITEGIKFKRLNELKPKDGKATYPQLLEILGIGAAYGVALSDPLDSFPSDVPSEVKAAIVRFAESAARNLQPQVRNLRKSLASLKRNSRPATLTEFQANSAAFHRGVSTRDSNKHLVS